MSLTFHDVLPPPAVSDSVIVMILVSLISSYYSRIVRQQAASLYCITIIVIILLIRLRLLRIVNGRCRSINRVLFFREAPGRTLVVFVSFTARSLQFKLEGPTYANQAE